MSKIDVLTIVFISLFNLAFGQGEVNNLKSEINKIDSITDKICVIEKCELSLVQGNSEFLGRYQAITFFDSIKALKKVIITNDEIENQLVIFCHKSEIIKISLSQINLYKINDLYYDENSVKKTEESLLKEIQAVESIFFQLVILFSSD